MTIDDTTETDPFSLDRLYGDEKYGLNNMQLKSVNFPARVSANRAASIWSDRSREAWRKHQKVLISRDSGDAFFTGVTDESLLTFANAMAKESGFPHEVTGVRVVRFTDGGGYPVLRLDIASGGSGLRRSTPPLMTGGRRNED